MTSNTAAGKFIGRDVGIIAAVIALVAVAYFVMEDSPTQPEHQHSTSGAQTMESQMGAMAELPTDYNGLVSTGNQLMDGGNYSMAAEAYRRSLEINPEASDVRTDFGACLHAMGLPDRAISEFHTVLKQEPLHGIATFNLGIVHYEKKQVDSAKYYWEKYLTIEPEGRAAEVARDMLTQIGN